MNGVALKTRRAEAENKVVFQIRNPKHEIRNKSECQMTETQNPAWHGRLSTSARSARKPNRTEFGRARCRKTPNGVTGR
jgi:hypothetical protein